MGKAACNLALGKVLAEVVHSIALAAVDGHAIALQHADPATEFEELRAGVADTRAVVAPKIRDGLVMRPRLADQPHHFDVAPLYHWSRTSELEVS